MSRTILLIEDNEQNRYLATFLLEKSGHRVVSTPDGPRGIELARELLPDGVLLDIQLPTMDGYAVARGLRGLQGIEATPIIAVTSYALVGDREKPINPETFVSEIRRHLSPPPVP